MSENFNEEIKVVSCPSGFPSGIASSALIIKDETDISKDLESREVSLSSIIEGYSDVCTSGTDGRDCCSDNSECCKKDS